MHTLNLSEIDGPMLVVAPHPDDETLGCGGLVAALTERGVLLHTLFITDGSASHRNSQEWPRERLSALREAEANEALALLGAANQPRTFLRLRDAAMPRPGSAEYEAATMQIETLLRMLKPSHVALPWRRDPHCDHQDTWHLLTDTIQRASMTPHQLEYTIWLEELGAPKEFPREGEMERISLEIGTHVMAKRKAMTAYRSQLGEIVKDDPSGFVLTASTLDRLINPVETFWRTCPAQ